MGRPRPAILPGVCLLCMLCDCCPDVRFYPECHTVTLWDGGSWQYSVEEKRRSTGWLVDSGATVIMGDLDDHDLTEQVFVDDPLVPVHTAGGTVFAYRGLLRTPLGVRAGLLYPGAPSLMPAFLFWEFCVSVVTEKTTGRQFCIEQLPNGHITLGDELAAPSAYIIDFSNEPDFSQSYPP